MKSICILLSILSIIAPPKQSQTALALFPPQQNISYHQHIYTNQRLQIVSDVCMYTNTLVKEYLQNYSYPIIQFNTSTMQSPAHIMRAHAKHLLILIPSSHSAVNEIHTIDIYQMLLNADIPKHIYTDLFFPPANPQGNLWQSTNHLSQDEITLRNHILTLQSETEMFIQNTPKYFLLFIDLLQSINTYLYNHLARQEAINAFTCPLDNTTPPPLIRTTQYTQALMYGQPNQPRPIPAISPLPSVANTTFRSPTLSLLNFLIFRQLSTIENNHIHSVPSDIPEHQDLVPLIIDPNHFDDLFFRHSANPNQRSWGCRLFLENVQLPLITHSLHFTYEYGGPITDILLTCTNGTDISLSDIFNELELSFTELLYRYNELDFHLGQNRLTLDQYISQSGQPPFSQSDPYFEEQNIILQNLYILLHTGSQQINDRFQTTQKIIDQLYFILIRKELSIPSTLPYNALVLETLLVRQKIDLLYSSILYTKDFLFSRNPINQQECISSAHQELIAAANDLHQYGKDIYDPEVYQCKEKYVQALQEKFERVQSPRYLDILYQPLYNHSELAGVEEIRIKSLYKSLSEFLSSSF